MTAAQGADRLFTLMDDLRACLCGQLEGMDVGACFCALLPGSIAPADCGCNARGKCGQAYVRLLRIFPSKQFPNVDTSSSNCGSILAAAIELGVNRCVPVADERGNPPTAADQANAVRQQISDAYSMWAAITCCDGVTGRPHLLGTYTPVGSGDCQGGIWPVTVHLLRADA